MLVALVTEEGELMRDDDDCRLLVFDVEDENEARVRGAQYPGWIRSVKVHVSEA